ncbi:hypothetical protein MGAST_02740 [Mycobacterium gastri 'Wayne']|nr:hypothetical protein MGAST_02740 [Mycobacterium gastri 'Wayne']
MTVLSSPRNSNPLIFTGRAVTDRPNGAEPSGFASDVTGSGDAAAMYHPLKVGVLAE